jgi:hypothetical protein
VKEGDAFAASGRLAPSLQSEANQVKYFLYEEGLDAVIFYSSY